MDCYVSIKIAGNEYKAINKPLINPHVSAAAALWESGIGLLSLIWHIDLLWWEG